MSRIISRAELDEYQELLSPENRLVDIAVRLQIIEDDGSKGGFVPGVFGGRWDRVLSDWVAMPPGSQWSTKESGPDILRVNEWTVHRQQLPVLLEDAADTIFVGIFAGRQAGKTHCAIEKVALDWLRWPGRWVATVSQDFKASRGPEETFRSLIAPWWGVKTNKADRTWTLPTGAQYIFRSEEAIDSLRGPSLKTLHLTEAALMRHMSFVTGIGCGAASKSFKVIVDTTPKREVKWIRDAYREWGETPKHKMHRLYTERNPRRNKELLASLAENLPADLYEQEIKGNLLPPQDRIWFLFDRRVHGRPTPQMGDVTREFAEHRFGVEMREKEPAYLAGWDFGREAVVVAKVFAQTYERPDGTTRRRFIPWLVGELTSKGERTNTEHHAALVREAFGTNIVIRTDAMGQFARAGGRGTERPAITVLEEAGFLNVEPCDSVAPRIVDRQLTTSRLLRNIKGDVQLYLDEDAVPELVDAFENQRQGANGKPVEEHGYEHIIDAATYLIWSAFPIEGEVPLGFRRAFTKSKN